MNRVAQVSWIEQLASDIYDSCHVTIEDYTEHDYTREDYLHDLKGVGEAELRSQPWYSDHDEQTLYVALARLCPEKGD